MFLIIVGNTLDNIMSSPWIPLLSQFHCNNSKSREKKTVATRKSDDRDIGIMQSNVQEEKW